MTGKDMFLYGRGKSMPKPESGRPPSVEEIEPWEVDPDEFEDVNEWVVEEWKRSTTAAERVQEVLETTTEPQTAREIADRARVSEPAAREHLKRLARAGGPAVAVEEGTTTRYMRDPDQARFKRIKTIADEATTTEIETAIREMKTEIRAYEDDYGVSSPEELARELPPDDDAGWADVSAWKTTRQNLSFAKTALAFKETRNVDAMFEGVTDGGDAIRSNDG